MTIHYQDDTVTLHQGDALEVSRGLEPESVNCIVTSPPYFGLRDYGVSGQYGLEESPAEYVETMSALFSELQRVLANDGTLWLNIGDSYYSGRGNPGPHSDDGKQPARRGFVRPLDRPGQTWGRQKSLLGIPWRVAFALQDDGWILRNAIIWNKPNAMPESVSDRLSCRYEHIFMFSKSKHYWFDLDPIREALIYPDAADGTRVFGGVNKAESLKTGSSARRTGNVYGVHPDPTPYAPEMGERHTAASPRGRNPGDVWSISTQPFSGAHFAVMPQELARRAIVAGCKPGGVVLDPFSGSGTTGLVATREGRRYVGIDLNGDYLQLSLKTRFAQPSLNLSV